MAVRPDCSHAAAAASRARRVRTPNSFPRELPGLLLLEGGRGFDIKILVEIQRHIATICRAPGTVALCCKY